MKTNFNVGRVILLLKRFFSENKQRELTFWSIVVLVFTIMRQAGTVEMFLYISGLIFAAQQFKIFAYNPSGMHYLLIPATHTEKLTASILLTIPYYFLMVVITYIIGTTVGITVQNLVFGLDLPINYIFLSTLDNHPETVFANSNSMNTFVVFAFLQSLFLLGSISFKRNAAVKTMLSISLILAFYLLVQFLMYKIDYSFTFNKIEVLYKVGFWIAIPFFWVVSYFKLTEKQV